MSLKITNLENKIEQIDKNLSLLIQNFAQKE